MSQVFISYSYSNREQFRDFHLRLKEFVEKELGVSVYSFVFDFKDQVSDKELMDKALSEVSKSKLLFVELSNKSIGIGIEAGYAKAKEIPIIYLVKEGTDLNQTMCGISSHIVKYNSVVDVINWVKSNKSTLS